MRIKNSTLILDVYSIIDIVNWVILFCFFTPAYFIYKEPFDSTYFIINYGRCGIALFLLLVYFANNKWKTNITVLWMALFSLSILTSSFFYDLNIMRWVKNVFLLFGLFAFIQVFAQKDYLRLFKNLYVYFFVMILINDIYILLNPNGFIIVNELGRQRMFFLAAKNTFSQFCIPMAAINHLCHLNNIISPKKFYITLAILLFPLIKFQSVTSIIGIVVFELIILYYSKKNVQYNNRGWFVIICIAASVQVLFTYIYTNDIFRYIILNYLKKDITLSGRSSNWEAAHRFISKHLLLGSGNGKDGYYYYTIPPGYVKGNIMWAHNTSMDLLTQGGILLFVFFIAMMLSAYWDILRKREVDDRIGVILLSGLLVYIIMGFSERFGFRVDYYFFLGMASAAGLMNNNSTKVK